MEGAADNAQFKFQTEKYRKIAAKEKLVGDEIDGYNQSGLYAVVRKPNYVAEQLVWISFYLFSVAATGTLLNWSASGCVLLVLLFQGSGWITELITIEKYPKYGTDYCERVGRYTPFRAAALALAGGGEEGGGKKGKKEKKKKKKKAKKEKGKKEVLIEEEESEEEEEKEREEEDKPKKARQPRGRSRTPARKTSSKPLTPSKVADAGRSKSRARSKTPAGKRKQL